MNKQEIEDRVTWLNDTKPLIYDLQEAINKFANGGIYDLDFESQEEEFSEIKELSDKIAMRYSNINILYSQEEE